MPKIGPIARLGAGVTLIDFNALFRRYGKDLVRFLTGRVACPDTAADLAQEAFLRMIQARAVEPVRDTRAYLFRTAANLASNHHRHRRAVPMVETTDADWAELSDPAPAADQVAMGREDLVRLGHAINTLPPRRREVFMLHRVENLEPDAIAARLGISRNMVDRHLRKALVHCLEAMEASG